MEAEEARVDAVVDTLRRLADVIEIERDVHHLAVAALSPGTTRVAAVGQASEVRAGAFGLRTLADRLLAGATSMEAQQAALERVEDARRVARLNAEHLAEHEVAYPERCGACGRRFKRNGLARHAPHCKA